MNLSQRILENLQRPRPLTGQVIHLLAGRWEVVADGDAVSAFFAETFPTLDEFEQEDLLAPLFTPGFEEKCSITPLLHGEMNTRPAGWISSLLGQLIASKPTGTLQIEGGVVLGIPIPESVLERYVGLLGLDRMPEEKIASLIRTRYPGGAGDQILTRIRERAWRSDSARDLLERWLDSNPDSSPTVEEVGFLTEWLGSHPLNVLNFTTLARNLTEWCEAHQKARSPFFNDMIGTVDDDAQRRAAGMLVQTKHAQQSEERLALASRLANRLGVLSAGVSAN